MLLAMRRASSMVRTRAVSALAWGFAAIDVSERLPVSVQHFIAAGDLLNLPWWQHARGPRWHNLPSAFRYAAWPMFELYAIMPIGWIQGGLYAEIASASADALIVLH